MPDVLVLCVKDSVWRNSKRFASRDKWVDPEEEMVLADSVGLALLVVLDMLTPAERLATPGL